MVVLNQLKQTIRLGRNLLAAPFRGAIADVPKETPPPSLSPKHLHFYVLGGDLQAYGPATLSVLQEWTQQGIILGNTWIFDKGVDEWKQARFIKEVHDVLPAEELAEKSLELLPPPNLEELERQAAVQEQKALSGTPSQQDNYYYVFASDEQVYGPAATPVLREWAEQGLVSRETWIYNQTLDAWGRASQIQKLQDILPAPVVLHESKCADITTAQLRRIRLFSDLEDHQVVEITNYLRRIYIPTLQPVARKGAHAMSMYILLDGGAEVLTVLDGFQKRLTTLQAGDFFGESTLLEEGPCAVDVNTLMNSTFVCLKHSAFQTLLIKHPDIAARFLMALVRHLSYYNMKTNERFAKARAMARGSLGRTGQILVPTVKVISR